MENKSNAENIKEQIAAKYDKFVDKFQEIFTQSKEKTKESMEKAMDVAREQLTKAGEFDLEQGKEFKDSLVRDLKETSYQIKLLGEDAKDYLDPARIGAGALATLSTLLHKAGSALDFLVEKTDKALTYKTGEVTSLGTFTCLKCEKKIHLKKTGHLPPCPGCSNTKFKKSY
ncbi:MAG: zinc ribbon-containing protein [Proteobacteria bacterium]|nr:zinc ribbon-containing protein [Pseudomonadota bacterium]MBU1711343.1 zinc ribbon-containing protein [Pseudomonadota bacterium]